MELGIDTPQLALQITRTAMGFEGASSILEWCRLQQYINLHIMHSTAPAQNPRNSTNDHPLMLLFEYRAVLKAGFKIIFPLVQGDSICQRHLSTVYTNPRLPAPSIGWMWIHI